MSATPADCAPAVKPSNTTPLDEVSVTVGSATAVNVPIAEYPVPCVLVAYALKLYAPPDVSPVTAFANAPTPEVSAGTSTTPAPPRTGSAFVAVSEYTTPRTSTSLPPALLTVPPSTALLVVTPVTVGEATVGGGGTAVVTVIVGP